MASIARSLPPAPNEDSRPSPKRQIRISSRAKLIIDKVVEKPDIPVEWPAPIGYALDELTPKQRHFAVCVASGISQTQAYKRAYNVNQDTPEGNLCSSASIIASHPKVLFSVKLLLAWLDREWLLESQEVVEYGYQRLYEEAENGEKSADRTRAVVALMKAHGAFISRSEVRHVHVNEGDGDQVIDAIGALLGLAAAKAADCKPSADPLTIDVASTRVIDSE